MEVNANFTENAKNDFHLVVKAREGNQKAYADLMHRYKDSIYFMALKMVNNKEDAMDLTVETFAKAFEKLEKYQPDYAFSTWLFRVATNNCIDFIRKKKLNTMSIHGMVDDDGEPKGSPRRSRRCFCVSASLVLLCCSGSVPEPAGVMSSRG